MHKLLKISINHYLGLVFILINITILYTSCSTTKNTSSYNKNTVQAHEVSKKLGFQVLKKDPNIDLYVEASGWLGTPYKYGGTTKKGVDCSGLIYQIYKKVYNVVLNRTANGMLSSNVKTIAKNGLQTGDLIFFATSKNNKKVTHVGLYLNNNFFIHASSVAGVVGNNLDEEYYKKSYKLSGRVKK